MKTLSAIYKGERVVELFEDIDLPKDIVVLVVIPDRMMRGSCIANFGALQKSSSQNFGITRRTKIEDLITPQ